MIATHTEETRRSSNDILNEIYTRGAAHGGWLGMGLASGSRPGLRGGGWQAMFSAHAWS